MGMTLVNAYNICLKAAGLDVVSSVEECLDPVDSHIDDAKRELLQNGTKFNTDTVTLNVSGGSIDVSEYLAVILPFGTDYDRLVVRNGKLWDPKNNEYWAEDIADAQVVVDLDWDDIASEWQDAIAHRAAFSFASHIKGGAAAELPLLQEKAYNYLCRAEIVYPNDYGKTNGIVRLLSAYQS